MFAEFCAGWLHSPEMAAKTIVNGRQGQSAVVPAWRPSICLAASRARRNSGGSPASPF